MNDNGLRASELAPRHAGGAIAFMVAPDGAAADRFRACH